MWNLDIMMHEQPSSFKIHSEVYKFLGYATSIDCI